MVAVIMHQEPRRIILTKGDFNANANKFADSGAVCKMTKRVGTVNRSAIKQLEL